jgi:hypothetical protein
MIHQGDVLAILGRMKSGTYDGVLTDPPYGLSFMGKDWDGRVPGVDVWSEVLRVLKPGAFVLAFGGARTFHRLTCAIEDAGFEIRDCMSWLYGQGFPKSLNLGNGYGTALKPAWEPVIVAMRPLDGTFAGNAIAHGVAGLNIDGSRIPTTEKLSGGSPDGSSKVSDGWIRPWMDDASACRSRRERSNVNIIHAEALGRWPANVILDPEAAAALGETSRFFYCAKPAKSERGEGNTHPTVKPIKLAEYLARLILPPKRSTARRLLVPFSGSGSEMIGAKRAGWEVIDGIEQSAAYAEIAKARIAA